MLLKDIISKPDIIDIKGDLNKEVLDVVYHSSKVTKGTVFVAVTGFGVDGHVFISEAINKGAVAIVCEKDINVDNVCVIKVANARRALAELSASFFGDPSNQLSLIGITGTNGKTTITYLLESIFNKAGLKPGVIGTVEHRFGNKKIISVNTTPESYDFQKLLRQMVDDGVKVCISEVSSHALELDRVKGSHFDAAVFTNLTTEHMDFHKDIESYFNSKKKLFYEVLKDSGKDKTFSVINIDDNFGKKIADEITHKLFRYSISSKSEVKAENVICDDKGVRFKVITPLGSFDLRSDLIGRFNVYNILAATSAAIGMGVSIENIRAGIADLKSVPGRFERVENNHNVLAFVDYAHTPDAIKNLLMNARDLANTSGGRLIMVFGCGGDRDRSKRPLMGEEASSLADIVFVTSDNPRTENPDVIIEDIVSGIDKENFTIIADRKLAITTAVEISNKNDVLVVAGKGHEDYQIIGQEKKHFSDRKILKQCFDNKK